MTAFCSWFINSFRIRGSANRQMFKTAHLHDLLQQRDQTGSLLIGEMPEEFGVVLVGESREDRHEFPACGRQYKGLKSPVAPFRSAFNESLGHDAIHEL